MTLFDLVFNTKFRRECWDKNEYIFKDQFGHFTKISDGKRESWVPRENDLSSHDWIFLIK